MKAVKFDQYGGIEVLNIVEVPTPEPGQNEVLVRVKATSINPGESKIREGKLHARWPATFPSGEGSDVAGFIEKLGPGVGNLKVGSGVIGFTDRRASHAEYVLVEAKNLTIKPAKVSWAVAGSLPIAGSTAFAAVRAVSLKKGDTVAISGAAGGVGSMAVQLAKRSGANVIGIASTGNHDWLNAHGIQPEPYGDGLQERLRQAKLDAFIDTHGGSYVKLASELGITPSRIDTIIDFEGAQQFGAKTEGSSAALNAAVLAELAAMVAAGELEVPIAATFPLDQVRAAFTQLERGHTRGKIVLLP